MMQPIHHSVADWDTDSTNFTLSPDRYTSPPTSLRATGIMGSAMLCNRPATLCLPEGRIRSQVWWTSEWPVLGQITFRSQDPIGQVTRYEHCYMVQIDYVGTRFWEWVNGRITWGARFPFPCPRDKWVQLEITWWNYPPYADKHPLAISFAAFFDGSWHDYGRAERELARWYDSPINRVGIYPCHELNYFDDFEIYAPI